MKNSLRSSALFLSFLYLALPLFLWSLSWLRTPWNVILGLLLFGCGTSFWRGTRAQLLRAKDREDCEKEERHSSFSWSTFLWIWAPMAFMSLWSGIGGFGLQMVDWGKHNSILWDLVNRPWPVRYPEASGLVEGTSIHLTYYLAYYIPAALIGKLVGWSASNVALQVWSLLGLALVALWLGHFFGRSCRWVGLAFCVFGGGDWIGVYANNIINTLQGSPQGWSLMPISPSNWARTGDFLWLLRSHSNSFNWVPQHALASWVLSSILLRNLPTAESSLPSTGHNSRALFHAHNGLCCALTFFWSPFAVVGALPFWWAGAQHFDKTKTLDKPFLRDRIAARVCWVSAVALSGVTLWYLLSRLPVPSSVEPSAKGVQSTFALYAHYQLGTFLGHALSFIVVQWGILLGLTWVLQRWLSPERRAWLGPWRRAVVTAAVILVALMGAHYGRYNDLMQDSSIPALFVVFIFVILSLVAWSQQRQAQSSQKSSTSHFVPKLAVAGILLLLVCGSLHTVWLFKLKRSRPGSFSVRIPQKNLSIYARYVNDPQKDLLTQYVGPDNSTFGRLLLKEEK